MLEYHQIIEALSERIRSLQERGFRPQRICGELERFSDYDVAHILEELYRGAIQKRRGYVQILEALTEFEVFKEHFGPRLSSIFEIADEEELLLAAEWLAPLPIQNKIPKGLMAHQDLSDLTLGERKWKARSADPLMLEKLLVDPDASVIANLLNHPHLQESEVVKICATTPSHPEVMLCVYRHPRWFARYQVKKALLNNPATPPRLVMLLLVWLSVQDMKDLLKSRRFSPGFIRQLLDERKKVATEAVVDIADEMDEDEESFDTDDDDTGLN